MDTRQVSWLELAKEAALTAAELRDEGGAYNNGRSTEWVAIAALRAAIAQAEAMTRAADALEKLATAARTEQGRIIIGGVVMTTDNGY